MNTPNSPAKPAPIPDAQELARSDKILIVYDTDVHGGVSGLVALKALRAAGKGTLCHYSHFELARSPQALDQPVTTSQWLAQALPQVATAYSICPGEADLIIIDIPVNALDPQGFVEALAKYAIGGRRVVYIDHHGHSRWATELAEYGVHVTLLPSSYDMTLALPRSLGVVDKELEKFALIGAIADLDESVVDKVSEELEEVVTEYLDTAWKQGFRSLADVQSMTSTYGNVGAIVQYLLARNVGPEGLLELARVYGRSVPMPQYEVRGEVAIMTSQAPLGLAWKSLAKICRVAGVPIATTVAETPRGVSVLVATNWRRKSEFALVVDRVVQEVVTGRSVVGHSGAKSILATSLADGQRLLEEIVRRLNEAIASREYIP